MNYPKNDINALYYYAEDMKVAKLKVTPSNMLKYLMEKNYTITPAQFDYLDNYRKRGLGESEIKLKLKSN